MKRDDANEQLDTNRRRIYSEGVKSLNLSKAVFDALEESAREQKPTGVKPSTFYYVPCDMIVGDKGTGKVEAVTRFVVCVFLKTVTQENIHANAGDVSFTLRAEWDEKLNPL